MLIVWYILKQFIAFVYLRVLDCLEAKKINCKTLVVHCVSFTNFFVKKISWFLIVVGFLCKNTK